MKGSASKSSHNINGTTSNTPSATKLPLSSRLSVQRDAVFDLLKQLAIDNEVYFRQNNNSSSVYGIRMADCCEELSTSIGLMRDIVRQLQYASRNNDYDEETPGNGFRSLICINDVVLLHLVSVLRICSENRGIMMFRLAHYCKEIEAYAAILRFLTLSYQQVVSMLHILDGESLFPPLEIADYQQYNIMFRGIESLDGSCFYGRPLGFQFCPSVTRIFRVIGLVLATYSLSWENGSAAISSLINSGRMLLNPEQRAKRIIKVTREADIGFCRSFWNLSELPMPKLFCPSMAMCELSEIKPNGPIQLETVDGGIIHIPEPSAHTGVRPISIKILSYSQRIGLSAANSTNRCPLSPFLVIHCHGGGYVATSSKSHETYLRFWAKSLNCPLVSIDYSLAPENPFPRPTEEVLYTYAWMLNNPEQFGWNGNKVCMVGDSAGGNLIVSVSLKLVELGVKRLPDGLVPIYTPFLFQYLPSPSRVLSFMDPLLHMGVIIRCAAAYTGSYSDEELDKNCTFHSKSNETSAVGNGHRSLQDYVDQVQRAQRDNILDFTQGSQSIVSLINLSLFNKTASNNNKSSMLDSSQSSSSNNNNEIEMEEVTSTANLDINSRKIVEARPAEDANVDAGTEEEEEEEESSDQTIQTVRVDSDPFHICLSSTNFDRCLIDYLQMHPLTKSSVHNLADPPTDNQKQQGHQQADVPRIDCDEQLIADEVFRNGPSPKPSTDGTDSTAQMPKSATTGSFSSSCFMAESTANRSPISLKVAESLQVEGGEGEGTSLAAGTPDFPSHNGTGQHPYSSAGSSVGRTPIYSKKRLTRNKYRSLSQSLADTAALAAGHAIDSITDWLDAPMEPLGCSDKKKLSRAVTLSPKKAAKLQQQEAENHYSHFTELLKLKLPRDHLMSPMYAPRELLAKMPPISFVACHLDPLLDDTVMFAKRVRDSGGCVKSVDLLDNLPHGFLNFAPMSTDCREGANLCLERIKQLLGM